jgi:DNA-binding LytR/AlgR family response regulator
MRLTCIVVDDEPLAIDQMAEYISKVPFLELKATFQRGLDAIMYLKENKTDILFLDIQMDDINGIQMLRSVKDLPSVILTTAYDQYAIEGYSLEVSDYLLKPIGFDRFVQAVDRLYGKTVAGNNVRNESQSAENYIFIKTDGKLVRVSWDDILFIEGQRDYLKFHLTGNRRIMTLLSFRAVEEQLPTDLFIRVHKSFIISVSKIDTIGKTTVKIGDREIPLGENYKSSLAAFLGRRRVVK